MPILTLPRLSGARRAPSLFSRFMAAREIARQRRALAALDDALLDDIGLTREEVRAESQRPVWDAPRHWTK
ncbi:DUF1127 domain-containing protein [Celeribacter persicus]|jgi:Uncharacterized conserved small protein|uniref:Uncharacterized protein YjiS (DUF1127 family) n=1 Tax=Celeribacter persicus TaxID=1651082 RepID=A0A2T5HV91_9RHOB|nr:DUF1127 domain-containing protein [Celeribacter persicus]PTQ75496.1 uncharacterized protein YjiS (DUF1127 family) [Celeribacter persicus]